MESWLARIRAGVARILHVPTAWGVGFAMLAVLSLGASTDAASRPGDWPNQPRSVDSLVNRNHAIPSAPLPASSPLPAQGLRSLADSRGVDLGVQTVLAVLDDPLWDPNYQSVLTNEYNTMLIDGEIRWGAERNKYDFTGPDRMLSFAVQNGLRVQAHHLVWGYEQYLPNWLKDGDYSREELLDILKSHVRTIVGRYKGSVHEWSVVNEALYGPGFIPNLWYTTIGPEYVELAFRWAREVDPDAILILNDNSNERLNSQSDHMYELAGRLKAEGVPIDGVGMEMHLEGKSPPDKDEVVQNMKRFGQLGLRVFVTEFDVDMTSVPGTQAERQAVQAKIYRDMLDACIESGACSSFLVFGLTDRVSWLYGSSPDAEPLPFDVNYNPKKAYYAIQEVLLSGPVTSNHERQAFLPFLLP